MPDVAGLRKVWTRHGPILIIMVGVLVVFGPAIFGPFHLDDYTLFSDPVVTSVSGGWRVWGLLQTRPLTYFTFWLNYQLGGDNPIGYHLVNLILHLAAVLLFYRTLERMFGGNAAFLAAALFALHPIQTEPVTYVFARAILISAIFCLLSLRFWFDEQYGPAVVCFGLALLGKEECVAFPLFLLMIRRRILPALCMLCLSLAAGLRVLLAIKLLGISGAGANAGISPLEYLSTQGTVILRYLRLLLVPYGFTFDPDIPIVRNWQAWASWLLLAGLVALFWKVHRNGKWLAAGLVLLIPSSTIFPAADIAADRRMYLPMIAFATFAGLALARRHWRKALVPAAAALALISAYRVHIWGNERTLWAEAVRQAPRKLRPRILLSRASDTSTALAILDDAQVIAPADARVPIEKGLRLIEANPQLALVEFERAVSLAPSDPEALNNLGVALARLGRRNEAIEAFRRASAARPCSASTLANLRALGVTYPAPCK
jgi:protein O-mannosyl-transferase